MARRKHTSARGTPVDFDLLHTQNKDVVAVGNANMNANGDVLGRGGKIVRKVEDIPTIQKANPNAAYNQVNPKSTKMVSLKDKVDAVPSNKPVLEDINEVEVLTNTKTVESKEPSVEPTEEKTKSKRKIVDSEE